MAGGKSREELLNNIVFLELRMFMAIEPSTPLICQDQPEAFKLMRRASHQVLSDETLESYLDDLKKAADGGRNLAELKFARIGNSIEPLSNNPLIAKIVEAEGKWLKELEKRYPLIFTSRSDFAAGVYLRCELETYSDKTLESYHKDVCKALEENRNLTAERYTFLFKQTGYDSIDDLDKERSYKRSYKRTV